MTRSRKAEQRFTCHDCGHPATEHKRGCAVEGCKCERYPSGIYSECLESLGYVVIAGQA